MLKTGQCPIDVSCFFRQNVRILISKSFILLRSETHNRLFSITTAQINQKLSEQYDPYVIPGAHRDVLSE